MNATVGEHKSHDSGKQKVIEGKVNSVIPDSKLQDVLKGN